LKNGNKIIYLVMGGMIALLLGMNILSYNEMKVLRQEVGNLQQGIFGLSPDGAIYALEERLLQEIRQGESLLTDSRSSMEFKNDRMVIKFSVVPKAVTEGDKITIALGDQIADTWSTNGTEYVANMTLKEFKELKPYVIIENELGRVQEALPEIFLDEHVAIDISSVGIDQDLNRLSLEISARTEESIPFMDALEEAEIIILDGNDQEIRRIPMVDSSSELHSQDYSLKVRGYEVNLPEDLFKLDTFNAVAVLKGYGITLTSDYVYMHSPGPHNGVSGSGFNVSFDE